MSKGEKETTMEISPRIQAKSAEYRKAVAANDRKYRQMVDTREAIESICKRIHLQARADMACESWGGYGDGHTLTDRLDLVTCPSCLDEVAVLGAVMTVRTDYSRN